MTSNHFIICHPLLLLPSIFPSIRVFSNELALHIRWPKYWSFNFSISLSNEYSGLISLLLTGLIAYCPRDSQKSSPALQLESINFSVLSLCYGIKRSKCQSSISHVLSALLQAWVEEWQSRTSANVFYYNGITELVAQYPILDNWLLVFTSSYDL